MIKGSCCNGHEFVINSAVNHSRVYINPALSHHRISREKYIHHDANLLLVLSSYMNGMGATELKRIAAALGLENYKTTKDMFNKTSKQYVGHIVMDVAKETVHEALVDDIRQAFIEKYPHLGEQEWQDFLERATTKNPGQNNGNTNSDNAITHVNNEEESLTIELTISADMGWQKRSSGRKYDSPSGHMFFVSIRGKIVAFDQKCVGCTICHNAKKKGKDPRPHTCFKNFDGHAKAMEAITCAELVTSISEEFNNLVRVNVIIADDDSSMRSHCSHVGGLPPHVHEPIFLADPSHRCKIMGKPLYKLASQKKSDCTLTTTDANRLKVYIAFFFNQNRDKNRSLEWMQEHVWCTLYHFFDDHRYCSEEFCYKKREQQQATLSSTNSSGQITANPGALNHTTHPTVPNTQPQEAPESLPTQELPPQSANPNNQSVDFESNDSSAETHLNNNTTRGTTLLSPPEENSTLAHLHALRSKPGYYRCMEKDKKLFNQLESALGKYFSKDYIKELMHNHNTQTNEGLNTSMCMSAPKFKNFSKSAELPTRVALVVGCHNLGKRGFIERVIDKMGFTNKPTSFLDLLEREDNAKRKRKDKQASLPNKKRRTAKRLIKALEGRKKDIEATRRGTTYGTSDNSPRSSRPKKVVELTCPYKEYGCNTPQNNHKSIQCSHCKYHYLWKQNKESENPQKISKPGWLEIVKAVRKEELSESISRNNITLRDIIEAEFGGNFSALCTPARKRDSQTTASTDSNDSSSCSSMSLSSSPYNEEDVFDSNMTISEMLDLQISQEISFQDSISSNSDDESIEMCNRIVQEHNESQSKVLDETMSRLEIPHFTREFYLSSSEDSSDDDSDSDDTDN